MCAWDFRKMTVYLLLYLDTTFFYVCVCVLVIQLCPTLCDSMDCSSLGFSVHGIL